MADERTPDELMAAVKDALDGTTPMSEEELQHTLAAWAFASTMGGMQALGRLPVTLTDEQKERIRQLIDEGDK